LALEEAAKTQWATTLCRSQHNIHSRGGKHGNSISGLNEFLIK